jgi:tetratricopeptide (TPR) repeat protein
VSASIRAREHPSTLAVAGIGALVATVVAASAYDRGAFALPTRSVLAIALWSALLLGLGLGLWPTRRPGRGTLAAIVLLAAFTAWTLASVLWAPSAESAYGDATRTGLYLAVFALAALAGSRATLRGWTVGLGVAIVAVSALALTSRFFPGTLPERPLAEFVPASTTRLSFPVEYWNGLGVLAALGAPLLLGIGRAATPPWRAAAVGVVPVLGAVVYLTSSRGAALALLLGLAVAVTASDRTWAAAGTAVVALGGTAGAVAVLASRHALLDGPLDSASARTEGRSAAILILCVCLATAAAHELAARTLARVPSPPRALRIAVAALAACGVLVTIGAAHPLARLDEFRQLPPSGLVLGGQAHLADANGSGRWQFWHAAAEQFADAPAVGGGAASFERWWAAHGSFAYFVRDAHSLYLETLAELGLVGFALLLAFLATALGVAAAGLGRLEGAERALAAGLVGACAAYLLAAGIDWMWELPVVTGAFVLCLGLLLAAGEERRERTAAVRPPLLAASVAGAALVVCAYGIPLLAELQLQASRDAAGRGDVPAALAHAERAEAIQPWAASTRLQVALVREQQGDFRAALAALGRVEEVDETDWRTWLVRARVEAAAGNATAARSAIARARALSPRSPAFARAS